MIHARGLVYCIDRLGEDRGGDFRLHTALVGPPNEAEVTLLSPLGAPRAGREEGKEELVLL